MGFEQVIGQDLIKKTLQRTLQQGQVAHAYLFSGAPGSGKKMLAQLFAQALNCTSLTEAPCGFCLSCRKTTSGNHPNLVHLVPQGAALKIEQVRDIRESLHYRTGEGRFKVCFIHEADRLTLPAANSLLKILEEPPGELVFILLSSRPWALLATVVSRCVHFSLKPLSADAIKGILQERFTLSPGEQEVVLEMAAGNPGQAVEMATRGGWTEKYQQVQDLVKEIEQGPGRQLFSLAEEVSKRENLDETLDLLFMHYRERWLQCLPARGRETSRLENTCHAVLQTKEELGGNVNRRLALETLFLMMRGVV